MNNKMQKELWLTEGEIHRIYKSGDDKVVQIRALTELLLLSRTEVIDILLNTGWLTEEQTAELNSMKAVKGGKKSYYFGSAYAHKRVQGKDSRKRKEKLE